jgi:hypothetical protein
VDPQPGDCQAVIGFLPLDEPQDPAMNVTRSCVATGLQMAAERPGNYSNYSSLSQCHLFLWGAAIRRLEGTHAVNSALVFVPVYAVCQ